MSTEVTRYHPLIVTLHWVIGLLILGNIAGGLYAQSLPNDAGKLWLLRAHMLGGLSILALILVRLVARLTTAKPPPSCTACAAPGAGSAWPTGPPKGSSGGC